jgi:hypothetical protein
MPDREAWRARLRRAADRETLTAELRAALDELLPPGALPDALRAEIATLFLDSVARARTLEGGRTKAAEALGPVVMLAARMKSPPPAPEPEPAAEMTADYRERFEAVFTEALCSYLGERLTPFQLREKGGSSLPFLLSPIFGEAFLRAVADHLAPTMLTARRIGLLAQTIPFEDLTVDAFFELFERPEKDNVLLYIWDDRWARFQAALQGGGKKDKAEGKGGLFGLFGGKDKKPAVVSRDELARQAEAFWSTLRSQARPDTYEVPKLADIPLLTALIRYRPVAIRDALTGVRQMLAQESASGGEGREGSSCQYLCKLVNAMPPHCGEFVALWALHACGKDFSPRILKQFQTSFGLTETERAKAIPYFMRWTPRGG